MKSDKEPDNLARDAAAARAAGMTYGKWKALRPQAVIEPKRPVESYHEFTCAYCGCNFIRYDNVVPKYCGARCRENAFRKAKREREQAGREK